MMASAGWASSIADCCWISVAVPMTRTTNPESARSSAIATNHFMIDLAGAITSFTIYSMPTLTSPRNPLLKEVRKAILRGTTTEDGFCVAESFHLLEEALRGDCEIRAVFAAESVRSAVESHVRGLKQIQVTVLSDELFRSISSTEASQGVVALVRPPA